MSIDPRCYDLAEVFVGDLVNELKGTGKEITDGKAKLIALYLAESIQEKIENYLYDYRNEAPRG